MPLTPEQLRDRAELAAKRRHHGDQAVLSDGAAAIEQAALDRHIAELVAAAPRMTAEQRATIRRVFRYGPPVEGGAVA